MLQVRRLNSDWPGVEYSKTGQKQRVEHQKSCPLGSKEKVGAESCPTQRLDGTV